MNRPLKKKIANYQFRRLSSTKRFAANQNTKATMTKAAAALPSTTASFVGLDMNAPLTLERAINPASAAVTQADASMIKTVFLDMVLKPFMSNRCCFTKYN
jgi:hypothetical protein